MTSRQAEIIELIRKEVKPALGCTEPIAVALATAKAMERLGGMPKFVANGWAAKDYTHINFYGGKRIAEELAEAIISEVYALVVEREAEAQRLEALERERKEAIERQVQAQMNSVMPLIEGMQITINK